MASQEKVATHDRRRRVETVVELIDCQDLVFAAVLEHHGPALSAHHVDFAGCTDGRSIHPADFIELLGSIGEAARLGIERHNSLSAPTDAAGDHT